MTLFVPNLLSRLTDISGLIQKPWNNFFSQFSSPPSAIKTIVVGTSPFQYQAGEPGTLFISGGTVSDVSFIRGRDTVSLGTPHSVLLMIQDIAQITYSVIPTIKFFPFYGAPK